MKWTIKRFQNYLKYSTGILIEITKNLFNNILQFREEMWDELL